MLLDSSNSRNSPCDCQRPEVLNKNLVQGNILLCGYSFNFVVGTASIKKVSETAKSLGAIGFVLAVENASPGTKFDPVPCGLPGILVSDVAKSQVNAAFSFHLIGYLFVKEARSCWESEIVGHLIAVYFKLHITYSDVYATLVMVNFAVMNRWVNCKAVQL